MTPNKPRVIKDFEKLDPAVQEMIREAYPSGYGTALISITNKDGMLISALPFETVDKYYLVKMPVREAKVVDEDDFDDEVFVKETVKPDLEDEFKEEFGSGDDASEEESDDDAADDDYDDDDEDAGDEDVEDDED
jgi:hypothetical protein